MELALQRAGRSADEIGYVNYHGTSTQLNDAVEARCVRRSLALRAERVPGSSTKSMIGHPQGASGAAGVVTTAMALASRLVPPTINLRDQDPACDLDFVPNAARAARSRSCALQLPGFRLEEQRARDRDDMNKLTPSADFGRWPGAWGWGPTPLRKMTSFTYRRGAPPPRLAPRRFAARVSAFHDRRPDRRRRTGRHDGRDCRGAGGCACVDRGSRDVSASQALRRYAQPWGGQAAATRLISAADP